LEEVLRCLGEVAPACRERVGTLRNTELFLPNLLWSDDLRGPFGFMKDTMELYPNWIALDPRMDNILHRRALRFSGQAA
jgi:hypothetical protein